MEGMIPSFVARGEDLWGKRRCRGRRDRISPISEWLNLRVEAPSGREMGGRGLLKAEFSTRMRLILQRCNLPFI